jgi:sugar phosphate isomerase/epimerase
MQNRRTFLNHSAAVIAASAIGRYSAHAAPVLNETVAPAPEISFFTKPLIGLSFERLGEALAEIGVHSIEAPIRPGGHVEPAKVEDELPKLVETLKKYGVTISILTSGISRIDPATHTEKVLRTAKQLGIEKYRMDWYRYDTEKPIWPQLDRVRPQLAELVTLSKEIGILPCYQNHSGQFVGAGVWDMALLMQDIKKEELAWSFDVMHAMIEGGKSWPTEVALASDRMAMAFFKNFVWQGGEIKTVPLADGLVQKSYVNMLRNLGFKGPVCLHVEYLEEGVGDPKTLATALSAIRTDLVTLKSWWS